MLNKNATLKEATEEVEATARHSQTYGGNRVVKDSDIVVQWIQNRTNITELIWINYILAQTLNNIKDKE